MRRTVLFLASNPIDTAKLRLDKELEEIDEGLKHRSQHRDEFSLCQKWAVRPVDLHRALLDSRPQVIHFSGHGIGKEGIFLEDNEGHSQLVKEEALSAMFALFPEVECVLLNACCTKKQAKAIAKTVSFVIGVDGSLSDSAAISFSTAFYDALGAGESYEFAYRIGCSAMLMHGVPLDLLPVLISEPKNVEIYNSNQKINQDSLIRQQQREYSKALGEATHLYTERVLNDLLTRLAKSQDNITNTQDVHLEGNWSGMVNGLEQVIKMRQKGTVVYLEGVADNNSEESGYVFVGEGRIIYGTLVFSWRIRDASGINVMSISADGNSLDGKYFTSIGGTGSEVYYREDVGSWTNIADFIPQWHSAIALDKTGEAITLDETGEAIALLSADCGIRLTLPPSNSSQSESLLPAAPSNPQPTP